MFSGIPFNDSLYLLTKGLPGCAFVIKIGHLFHQKSHFCLLTKVAFLNDVCPRQMMLAKPMMFPVEMMSLRWCLRQTSHHCE